MFRLLKNFLKRKSTFDPVAHGDYAPNPVQLQFLRLVGQRYKFVGLGDTNHNRAEIKAFALNTSTIRALQKPIYFKESFPKTQIHYDALNDASNNDETSLREHAKKSFEGGWLSTKEEELLSEIFQHTCRDNPGTRFIAADHRFEAFEGTELFDRTISFFAKLPWYVAVQTFLSVRHWSFDKKFREKGNFVMPDGDGRTLISMLNNDTATHAFMREHANSAAIFYGEGHFNKVAEKHAAKTSLRSLLSDGPQSLCVLALFKDAAQHDEHIKERFSPHPNFIGPVPPDANLFVLTDDAHPDGIEIINQDLMPLFEEAKAAALHASLQ